jgi:hypothetical protein
MAKKKPAADESDLDFDENTPGTNVLDEEESSPVLKEAQSRSPSSTPAFPVRCPLGAKACELHAFTPNDGPKIAEAKRRQAEEARTVAAAEEARRVAVIEEARRVALVAAEEARKAEELRKGEEVRKAEETRRLEDEANRRLVEEQRLAQDKIAAETKIAPKPIPTSMRSVLRTQSVAASGTQQIDFEAEARKAARILGCFPAEARVSGADRGNVNFRVSCTNQQTLVLSCDSTGLCLEKKSN